ncbi:hypothetical protein B0H19DRAFT_1069367 [Mycena capillaripes]|nr:hypothetical protein B0H19DRAFT_1069367 [Mycena capillaripes]
MYLTLDSTTVLLSAETPNPQHSVPTLNFAPGRLDDVLAHSSALRRCTPLTDATKQDKHITPDFISVAVEFAVTANENHRPSFKAPSFRSLLVFFSPGSSWQNLEGIKSEDAFWCNIHAMEIKQDSPRGSDLSGREPNRISDEAPRPGHLMLSTSMLILYPPRL